MSSKSTGGAQAPDYEQWLKKKPGWTPEEAAALVMGYEPNDPNIPESANLKINILYSELMVAIVGDREENIDPVLPTVGSREFGVREERRNWHHNWKKDHEGIRHFLDPADVIEWAEDKIDGPLPVDLDRFLLEKSETPTPQEMVDRGDGSTDGDQGQSRIQTPDAQPSVEGLDAKQGRPRIRIIDSDTVQMGYGKSGKRVTRSNAKAEGLSKRGWEALYPLAEHRGRPPRSKINKRAVDDLRKWLRKQWPDIPGKLIKAGKSDSGDLDGLLKKDELRKGVNIWKANFEILPCEDQTSIDEDPISDDAKYSPHGITCVDFEDAEGHATPLQKFYDKSQDDYDG